MKSGQPAVSHSAGNSDSASAVGARRKSAPTSMIITLCASANAPSPNGVYGIFTSRTARATDYGRAALADG